MAITTSSTHCSDKFAAKAGKGSPCEKLLTTVVLVGSIATFFYIVATLLTAVYSSVAIFDSDEAAHAKAALDIYQALFGLPGPGLFEVLRGQVFYPPLHSIFLAVVGYLPAGISLYSSRIPSLLTYVFAIVFISGRLGW